MRATILILALAVPAAAAAQDTAFATRDVAAAAASVQAPGAAPPPPPPPERPAERKRRGSMVGYITDASIESQLRVRFDSAFHNNRPDRSEFFYGQCRCNGEDKPGPSGLATDLNFQQVTVDAQYAVKGRVALLAAVPARFIQPQTFMPGRGSFEKQSGLSDVRGGVKVALLSTDDSLVTAQLQGYFKTGDAAKGLGTNHTSIETTVLMYRKLSDRVAIESQLGDWHPMSSSTDASRSESYAGDVVSYGIGPSLELVRTDRLMFAPVIELVGWHTIGGFQSPEGDSGGTNIVNLKVGARATFGGRTSFYLGYGHALTEAVWYTDIVRFEYRFSF